MKTLLIDDVRDVGNPDIIARNYQSGIIMLSTAHWDLLLLDHDLASYDEHGKEKTGYDIMCWLEQYPERLPKKIELVTSNPVGRKKMQTVIDKLYKGKK
jgi:hypothetical protein